MSLLLLPFGTDAQEIPEAKTDPIETDRPDQTETPAIVPHRMFQVETGFIFEQENKQIHNVTAPTILWKYGITEFVELRLITEFLYSANEKISGLNPVRLGFKARLSKEKGIIPQTSIIAHVQIPNWASNDLRADRYVALFRFTMQHTLSNKIKLGYNLGAEWDGIEPEATFVYTLTTGFELAEKWGSYVELYGFAPQNSIAWHNFDGGITYLVSNNFMLDISGGFGITAIAPDYFVGLGFSFRI
jgi:hypothetical protein